MPNLRGAGSRRSLRLRERVSTVHPRLFLVATERSEAALGRWRWRTHEEAEHSGHPLLNGLEITRRQAAEFSDHVALVHGGDDSANRRRL